MNNNLTKAAITGNMRIAAHIRYKHGLLWEILQRRGISIRVLAEKAGIAYGTLIGLVGLNSRPAEKTALAIQNALGEMGEYLDIDAAWPKQILEMVRRIAHIERLRCQSSSCNSSSISKSSESSSNSSNSVMSRRSARVKRSSS